MSLPGLSIKQPVLAFMVNAVLILFGIIAYQRLGVDRFPYIEFPVIAVTTTLPGANPEIVDASMTSIIETAVNSVPGIDSIQSSSSPGTSVVAITFGLDKNVDVAFNEVQAKINQILRQLPQDADPPIVAKVETNASPIMWLSLQGDRTLQQLNQYARNVIKKQLETIPGVGEVRLGGKRDRTIRVELDPDRMAAFGVTADDLMAAFAREHVQLPGGFLVSREREALLKLDLEFHRVDDLAQMVVGYRDGASIQLNDVADVHDSLGDFRAVARFNGQPTVGLGIVKIANTNTVAIIEEVTRRLNEEIRPQLPPGMDIQIASDTSTFIIEMVDALKEHLILGTVLAALVVWLFLKSFRSTLIIATAIPVSLFGAIAVMLMFGYTINTMTLLALLLLIGVVVDDAIVVLENIFRHREHIDPDPVSAAVNGTNQVVFAVLAATLTLVSIFAPVIFMGGIIGRFFESFAVVVTFGVLVSWLVSMTLTPMLCANFLVVNKGHGRIYNWLESGFQSMERGYTRLVRLALRFRWSVVGISVLVVLSSGYFFAQVGKGFVPEEDEGIFLIIARTPLGSSVSYTEERLRQIEQVLADEPAIATYFTAVGLGAGQANSASAFVRMRPREEREVTQQELVAKLGGTLAQIPGVRAFPTAVPIVGGARGEPLQFVVTGPDLEQVAGLANQLQARLVDIPGMGRLDLDLQLDLPQLEMQVDRLRAAALGVSPRQLALAVNVLAGGIDVAKYSDLPGDGERYDIRLKGKDDAFRNADDLQKIYLRSASGELIRLDSVVHFKEALGPAVITRYNLQYAANFYGTPEVPLGEAVNLVRDVAAEVLPLGYRVQFTGEASEFGKTVGYMLFAFTLAIVLMYMVLASQFNSFLQPIIIMVAQPLAMIGGVAALWLTAHTLNIYSMIGLVLLLGLVAKNSILLVDLTNQERARGRSIDEALLEACPIRLRPVLMTSLTVILALLPAALGLGAGADTNGPLSVAVIGGMITSTALTLVVVPSVYSLMEGGLEWLRRRSDLVHTEYAHED
ncbi:MAG TPA: efflux RND transporter permease subunit [Gammaproteobacteria bacterium]|nr:efflux RND transporter permease subunit [Gammaproteobacteria bacterium]